MSISNLGKDGPLNVVRTNVTIGRNDGAAKDAFIVAVYTKIGRCRSLYLFKVCGILRGKDPRTYCGLATK